MTQQAQRTTGGKPQQRRQRRRRVAIDLSLAAFFAAFVAATAFSRPALAAAGTASVTGAIAWPGEYEFMEEHRERTGKSQLKKKPSIAHSFFSVLFLKKKKKKKKLSVIWFPWAHVIK